ncbi:MAG: bacteriocin family protein [bacterium]|nr:bacteriocin family protein [bacterium]
MEDLLRRHAPISSKAWELIDEQAKQALTPNLAARQVLDFVGPKGWRKSAVNLGRVKPLEGTAVDGVQGAIRQVQPLTELRSVFELSRQELETAERGAPDPDLEPLVQAAIRIARAEDKAVFHGWKAAGIEGIVDASPHAPITIPNDYEHYPRAVAEATRVLRMAGVGGTYAIALGPRCYTGLMQAMSRGGYPVLEVVRQVVGGPVVWAPSVDGAVVLTTRGGDFELTVGQDISIGYLHHSATSVCFYLLESMTFRVLTPEAAVWLKYA